MRMTPEKAIEKLHALFKARAEAYQEKGEPKIDFSDLVDLDPGLKKILIATLKMFAYGESAEEGLALRHLVGKADGFCKKLNLAPKYAKMLEEILHWYAAEEARHGRLLKEALVALGDTKESKSPLVTILLVLTSQLPLPYSSGFLATAEIGAHILYSIYAEYFPKPKGKEGEESEQKKSSICILSKLIAGEEGLHILLHQCIYTMWKNAIRPEKGHFFGMNVIYLAIIHIVWKIGGTLATVVSPLNSGDFTQVMLHRIYSNPHTELSRMLAG